VGVTANGTTTTFTTSTLAENTHYYWRILATNGTKSTYSGVYSFWTPGVISGTVYDDVDGTCGGSGSNLSSSSMKVTFTPDSGTPDDSLVASDGGYSIGGASSGYGTLSLTNIPAGYFCSACSDGCTQGSVLNPSNGNDFYLTLTRNAWWQVAGGGIYAGSLELG